MGRKRHRPVLREFFLARPMALARSAARERVARRACSAPVNGRCAAAREAFIAPRSLRVTPPVQMTSSKDARTASRCSRACASRRCGHLPGSHADAGETGARGGHLPPCPLPLTPLPLPAPPTPARPPGAARQPSSPVPRTLPPSSPPPAGPPSSPPPQLAAAPLPLSPPPAPPPCPAGPGNSPLSPPTLLPSLLSGWKHRHPNALPRLQHPLSPLRPRRPRLAARLMTAAPLPTSPASASLARQLAERPAAALSQASTPTTAATRH